MSNPPQLPPHRKPGTVRALKAVVAVGGLVALGLYLNAPKPAPSVAGQDAAPDDWAGVWMRADTAAADSLDLPLVELRPAKGGLAGRLIVAGVSRDVGLPLHDLAATADALTFATTGVDGRRADYRLARVGPQDADLFAVQRPGQEVQAYLDDGGRTDGRDPTIHSREMRERMLTQLKAPQPPRLMARLRRLDAGPGKGTGPAAKPAPSRPATDAPAGGLRGARPG